jgi:hypothetical protein
MRSGEPHGLKMRRIPRPAMVLKELGLPGKPNHRVISGAFGKVYAVELAVDHGPFQEVRLGRSTNMRDFSSQRLLQSGRRRRACALASVRRSVGSRAGARTVGAGGNSITFVVDRSPATIVTFPAPATSNAACGFPALRFPACFMPRVMGPIMLGRLSARRHDEPDSH